MGRHLSGVKSLAQGQDFRTARPEPQQPDFSDISDSSSTTPVCGLQLLLLLLHLARDADCQASPASSAAHQDFLVPWLKPCPDFTYSPISSGLKVIKQPAEGTGQKTGCTKEKEERCGGDYWWCSWLLCNSNYYISLSCFICVSVDAEFKIMSHLKYKSAANVTNLIHPLHFLSLWL